MGLKEALLEAHALREVADASPLATFGLYRLMLAALQWAMPLKDLAAWRAVWKARRFPPDALDDLARRGRLCFCLFDISSPFYQDATAKPFDNPVSALVPDLPGATNIAHFRHSSDDRTALCPACCARSLVALPAFCTSGGSGKQPSINEAPPWYFLPCGTSLFQTLMLNLPIPGLLPDWPSAAPSGDVPTWEGHTSGPGPVGFMEGLTWQPRRVLLKPTENTEAKCRLCGAPAAVKHKIAFLKGRPPPRDRCWEDPHVLWRAERGARPSPVRPGREPAASDWRVAPRAMLADDGPPIVRQIRELVRRGDVFGETLPTLGLQSFAFYTRQMRYSHAAVTAWPLPLVILAEPEVADALRAELDFAEVLMKDLGKARLWAEAAAHVGRDESWARWQAALVAFEAQAERAFGRLIAEVAAAPADAARRIAAWRRALRGAAERHCCPASSALRPLTSLEADRRFRDRLNRAFAAGGNR